ncbi:MAG: RNA methyltransferase [Acidimicrobiales bacterium]
MQRLRRLLQRRSARSGDRAFVAEGAKLLDCALDAGASVEAVYVGAGTLGQTPVRRSVERAMSAGARAFELAPGVLEKVADTVTPQPVLAVVRTPEATLDDIADAQFVVVCVDVRDPGNAGALIRSADAAGAGGVVCCDGTVDPFNPKTVRASAGSVLHLPLVTGVTAPEALDWLVSHGFMLRGAVAHGGTPHTEVDWSRKSALVLGNEASGLDDTVRSHVGELVSVNMTGHAESLNVAIAGAVLCFEALRQRSTLAGVADAVNGRNELTSGNDLAGRNDLAKQ